MIRGYFYTSRGRRRPSIDAIFQFPAISSLSFRVRLLVDTGADVTLIAPHDARRLQREMGVSFGDLRQSVPSAGIGGQVNSYLIDSVLTLENYSTALPLTILEPALSSTPMIPSLLGRDVMSQFALFMEESTRRVLLLEPQEVSEINFSRTNN